MVDVIESNAQMIHCKVTHKGTWKVLWYTVAYGFNTTEERKPLWRGLKTISRDITGSWVFCGDFNNVLHLNERIGSLVTLDEVEPFRFFIRMCGL